MKTNYNYAALALQLGYTGRQSGDQIVGLCPLHHDRKPSFSMNARTGMWTCFVNCGAGNFPQLVMKVQGITLARAYDWMLHNSAIVPIAPPKLTEEVEDDMRWLDHWNRTDRKLMPQWWFDRGFTWETAERFDMHWDDNTKQLIFPYYVMIEGDRQLLGTVTRNFERGPKYQNSPKLPRSKYLYGLAQHAGPLILICEGPTDAIWLKENGFPAAALLGLNMSAEHIILLNGFTEICLALDQDIDNQGQEATAKIEARLRNSGRLMTQLTSLQLPEGRKDVGECAPQELEEAVKNRRTM